MTPLHLEILMHYYVSPDLFRATNPTIREYRCQLVMWGLLEMDEITPSGQGFLVTDKGTVWIEKALSTPMPTMKWVWE